MIANIRNWLFIEVAAKWRSHCDSGFNRLSGVAAPFSPFWPLRGVVERAVNRGLKPPAILGLSLRDNIAAMGNRKDCKEMTAIWPSLRFAFLLRTDQS